MTKSAIKWLDKTMWLSPWGEWLNWHKNETKLPTKIPKVFEIAKIFAVFLWGTIFFALLLLGLNKSCLLSPADPIQRSYINTKSTYICKSDICLLEYQKYWYKLMYKASKLEKYSSIENFLKISRSFPVFLVRIFFRKLKVSKGSKQ